MGLSRSLLVRRADAQPNDDSRLCSCHFKDGDKRNLPSIFNRNKDKVMQFTDPEIRPR